MKVLVFCPTSDRVAPQTVERILAQDGLEFCDLHFTRDNPYKGNEVYQNIQLNYEKMRQLVLKNGYDKVWIVEDDVIPPQDALKKLLAVDAPVVSGLYALRHGPPSPNVMRVGNMPTSGELFSWKQIQNNWGKVVRISGGCMGCLLLDRSVVEQFCFETGEHGSPDMQLMQFCWKNEIRQMADLSVVCGHVRHDGEIIWPDLEKGYRVERLAA